MMQIRHRLELLVLVGLTLLVSACMTPIENQKERTAAEQVAPSGNESRVIGRIQWMEKGAEKKIGKGMFAFSITPGLLRLEDRSRLRGEVGEDGSFIWRLTPGIYVIHMMEYRDPVSGLHMVFPKVAFRVRRGGAIYDIGTLRADFSPKRGLLGDVSGPVRMRVEDQPELDLEHLAESLGAQRGEIEKAPMVIDQRLPSPIFSDRDFDAAAKILESRGFGVAK